MSGTNRPTHRQRLDWCVRVTSASGPPPPPLPPPSHNLTQAPEQDTVCAGHIPLLHYLARVADAPPGAHLSMPQPAEANDHRQHTIVGTCRGCQRYAGSGVVCGLNVHSATSSAARSSRAFSQRCWALCWRACACLMMLDGSRMSSLGRTCACIMQLRLLSLPHWLCLWLNISVCGVHKMVSSMVIIITASLMLWVPHCRSSESIENNADHVAQVMQPTCAAKRCAIIGL